MLSLPIGIRTVGANETQILGYWCEQMLATKIWDNEVYKEVLEADIRFLAFLGSIDNMIGFASIRPNGDPDKRWNGHMWFDHLIKRPDMRGVEILEKLYEVRLEYARRQPQARKVFCVPFAQNVVKYTTEHGWRRVRPPGKDAPNGIFKLSRSALQ